MNTGQFSDYIGAAALLADLPKAQWVLADRGYDADWYRDAFQASGITPCILSQSLAICPSKTNSAATKAAVASRSCLAA